MSGFFREPERDPELGNALRRIEAAWETDNSEALRRGILAAAGSRLAPLGPPAVRWWEWISAQSRVALPVGLAASLAFGLLIHRSTVPSLGGYSTDLGSDSTVVLAALSEPAIGSQFTAHLIAPEGNDWLLQQAVGQ
jgi:ferric-dicitrate binding protein FerR (iron transport regulator)